MQLIWKHNPWLISIGRLFLNTRAQTCPCLPLILSPHGKYLPFPLQITFLRRYLKILLYIQIYIVIYKETSRESQTVGDSFVVGKKSWIFGTLMSKVKKKRSLWFRSLPMNRKDKRKKAALFSRSSFFKKNYFPRERVFDAPNFLRNFAVHISTHALVLWAWKFWLG